MICSVMRVTVTARARAFSSNEIFVFVISVDKVNYNNLV